MTAFVPHGRLVLVNTVTRSILHDYVLFTGYLCFDLLFFVR